MSKWTGTKGNKEEPVGRIAMVTLQERSGQVANADIAGAASWLLG